MTFVLGLMGLSFLVFFHELGHFFAARIFGVKVEAFSIGMGPVLLHKTVKGVDYRLSLVPIGGYCAMKGEQDFAEAVEQGKKEITGDPDSFYVVHPLKRLLIAFAGPFFNWFFGFAAFILIATIGYTYYSAGTKVDMADEVYPGTPSPAHESGMKSGDTILSINDIPMNDFSEIAEYVATHPDQDVSVKILRDENPMDITVHTLLDKETGAGKIGIVSDPNSVTQHLYKAKGFFDAIREGFVQSSKIIRVTITSIPVLFKGVKITNAVSGPVRITSILGSTVQSGFSMGIKTGFICSMQFLALISISLFLTNLLPVPILDGGLILFALIEFIRGKKIPPKILLYIQYCGIAIVAALFILSLTGDIFYFMRK
ncbi:MAG: site-2 protease family protein [Treponema sp.]|nr:site-2 protease family protein [Treponema sp.]